MAALYCGEDWRLVTLDDRRGYVLAVWFRDQNGQSGAAQV